MTARTVVVTGATGTVGAHLCASLSDAGYRVVGISRRPGRDARVEHVALDLASETVSHRFGDAPVIHAAAVTRDGWDSALERDTVAMTTAALGLSDGPFIQLSSSSVYDLRKPSVRVSEDEATGTYPFLNSYSRSKWQSEELVRSFGKTAAVILRPHAIYGDNDSTLAPRVRRAVRGGRLFLPGGGRVRHALTSVDIVSRAVIASLAALESSRLSGVHTMNVTDPTPTMLADAIAQTVGTDFAIRSIPNEIALAAGTAVEGLTPRGREPRLSRYAVYQLMHERTYDLSRATALLGIYPTRD